jgi:hypothetical protein
VPAIMKASVKAFSQVLIELYAVEQICKTKKSRVCSRQDRYDRFVVYKYLMIPYWLW